MWFLFHAWRRRHGFATLRMPWDVPGLVVSMKVLLGKLPVPPNWEGQISRIEAGGQWGQETTTLLCVSAGAGTGPKHSSFSQISRNVSAMPCPVVSRNYARSLIHPWRLQNEFDFYKRSSKRDVNLYRFQICPFGLRL